jgi:hypothetical protein
MFYSAGTYKSRLIGPFKGILLRTRFHSATAPFARTDKRSLASLRDYLPILSPVGNPQGRIVIIGSGWAGYKMLRGLDKVGCDKHAAPHLSAYRTRISAR